MGSKSHRDIIPDIRPAGITAPSQESYRIIPEWDDRQHEDVSMVRRHGSDTRFGSKPKRDTEEDNIPLLRAPLSELSEYLEAKKESIYRRCQREPLGRSFTRNTVFPTAVVNDPHFRFGKTCEHSSETAGESIFPARDGAPWLRKGSPAANADDIVIQRKIEFGYNWEKANIDPLTHRFGSPRVAGEVSDSAANCLDIRDRTLVSSKRLTDTYVNVPKPHVGMGKPFPNYIRSLPVDHCFGYSRASMDETTAWDCIANRDGATEDMVENDSGRAINSTQNRNKNIPDIVHGIVSIKGESCSLAKGCIWPKRLSDEFCTGRSADEIRELWSDSGLDASSPIFQQALQLSIEY